MPATRVSQVRLTEAQFAYLDSIRERTGIGLSSVLRMLVDGSMSQAADALGQREYLEQLRDAGVDDENVALARELAATWEIEPDLFGDE